nr:hypothetical protein [Bacillus subtilis]
MLELLALPESREFLMGYAGVLVFQETKHVSGRIGELCGSEHVVLDRV